ncbi:hypothetical protein K503DRAFT_454175 [Rhizopogon vinicolor AM-OR11-026]|uniref:F-box domain-containing protein n=1 Tax=Rhizopogon vinicolor AM-OR11-026 TaxID=1314800 RepID=A0A1B7MP16_9AGAM|nr:hypothetical protein K503DRAFT_454175 [Rhizopogon vinicolor AM-OR11-026]
MRKVMHSKVMRKVMDIIKIRCQRLVKQKNDGSALWCLPVEILCQIFVHCLPEIDHLRDSPELAPILLTGICRRWREIVVNTPGLWCRLYVVVYSDNNAWRKAASLYSLWLKRSQGYPLSLAIECPNPYNGTAKLELESLLQLYKSRITSLQLLSMKAAVVAEPLLQNLPALQELTLHCIYCIPQLIPRLPCTVRNLKLQKFTFDTVKKFNLSTCKLWVHLTNVEIAVDEPHEFFHLFNLCPNLSSSDVSLNFSDAVVEPLQPCMHANLQFLSIKCYGSSCSLRTLFKALTLPSLHVLFFSGASHPWWFHEEFKAFLARSNYPLKCLILGAGFTMTDAQQAEYLALTPPVEVQWRKK